MSIVIRQASISDKNAIWDFIKVAYGDEAQNKIPERWVWQFIENPLVNRNGKELPIFIALEDEHVVGQLGAVLSHIKIGEEIHQVAASCDLIVLPDCRGKGIAQKLIQAIAEHHKIYYTISCSKATRRIFDRIEHLGYHRFYPIPTYRKFVKLSREFLYRFFMKKTINRPRMRSIAEFGFRYGTDKIITLLANFLIEIRDLFKRKSNKDSFSEIKEIERFGDDIDQLWTATCDKFKIIVKRDKQFLNWRFSDCPQLHYRKFICRRNSEIKGYIVIRKPEPSELNVGIIVDLFAAPDDHETIENLVHYAVDFFGKDIAIIECPTSLKEYQKVLSKSGFLRFEKTEPIFFCMDSKHRIILGSRENRWFITKADQDWDQLRPI